MHETIHEISFDDLNRYPVIRYGSPDGFYVDILVKIDEMLTCEDLEYQTMQMEGHEVRTATAETLRKMKEGAIRPKDQNDVLFLRAPIKSRGRRK